MAQVTESTVEEVALSWFDELGYGIAHGPVIAPGEPEVERDAFGDVALVKRLRDAIDRLNPDIPAEAREEAVRKVLRPDSPSLVGSNRASHGMSRDSVEVEYRGDAGTIRGGRVRMVDFDQPVRNGWLALNQFAVIDGQNHRRTALRPCRGPRHQGATCRMPGGSGTSSGIGGDVVVRHPPRRTRPPESDRR